MCAWAFLLMRTVGTANGRGYDGQLKFTISFCNACRLYHSILSIQLKPFFAMYSTDSLQLHVQLAQVPRSPDLHASCTCCETCNVDDPLYYWSRPVCSVHEQRKNIAHAIMHSQLAWQQWSAKNMLSWHSWTIPCQTIESTFKVFFCWFWTIDLMLMSCPDRLLYPLRMHAG